MPVSRVVRPKDMCDSPSFTVRRWSQPTFAVRLCNKRRYDDLYGGDPDYYIADGPHARRTAVVSDAHHRPRPPRPEPPAEPERLAGEPEEV